MFPPIPARPILACLTLARLAALLTLLAASLLATPASAATLDGSTLGLGWALPFAGLLLSIALLPLLAPHFWEHHQGKIAVGWALLALLPLAARIGPGGALDALGHALLLEYMPFILLIGVLFTVAGGILVKGNIHGSPGTNVMLLTIGAVLASFIGTVGASMVMIRPVLRANDDRPHNAHVVVFFIFIVSNIGGALTPLGDPPLFLGFLRGVDFFWTLRFLIDETLFIFVLVMGAFYLIDSWFYRREGRVPPDPTPDSRVQVSGGINFLLIFAIIGAILMSANVTLGTVTVGTTVVELENLLRDAIFVGVALVSIWLTPREWREANGFSWAPVKEVAKLFLGIFICMIPVLAMLKAGTGGAFAPLVALISNPDGTPNPAAYFWLTGILSTFLDNAPTYVVFFELAGGDPQRLMTEGALTLTAISAGAVFMGANSYIGNAPNFMVYAIAKDAGVKMPSFFGYMAWSVLVLLPVFALTTILFFR